jgi:putative hemolysin
MMEATLSIISILSTLLLIGIFVGIEVAFVSANKISLELNKKQGTYAGKIWGGFAEQPTKLIGAILVAFTFTLVIYGMLIGKLLFPIWQKIETWLPESSVKYVHFIKLFVEILLSTSIVIFIVFLFRALFKSKSKAIVSSGAGAYIGNLTQSIFASISGLFVSMAEWILLYVFNVKVNDKQGLFVATESEQFVQQNKMHNEVDNSEINKELFENALSLRDVRLRECLVPRKEIVGLGKESSIEDVKKLFIETQLSKLVVFDNNIDTITGYIHQLDLFKNPTTIEEIILPIPTVPETMSATDLMAKFSKERKSIAWVIDEFGGTAGIVTMEDLLEEIFGDIKDEYDDEDEFVDKQLSENEYLFSGRLELDNITQKYGLIFSEDETAETLSGYIVQHNENLPKEKQQIIVGNYEFSILSMSDTRIETVKLKVLRR